MRTLAIVVLLFTLPGAAIAQVWKPRPLTPGAPGHPNDQRYLDAAWEAFTAVVSQDPQYSPGFPVPEISIEDAPSGGPHSGAQTDGTTFKLAFDFSYYDVNDNLVANLVMGMVHELAHFQLDYTGTGNCHNGYWCEESQLQIETIKKICCWVHRCEPGGGLDSNLENILTMNPGGPNDQLCEFVQQAIDEWNGLGADVDGDGTPGDNMPPGWLECLGPPQGCADANGNPVNVPDPRADPAPPCDC